MNKNLLEVVEKAARETVHAAWTVLEAAWAAENQEDSATVADEAAAHAVLDAAQTTLMKVWAMPA